MRVWQRSPKSPYSFTVQRDGKKITLSTGVRNKKAAQEIASAWVINYAKIDAGILEPESKPMTLRQFRKPFLDWVNSGHDDHPETRDFYRQCFDRLLEFKELADCDLVKIDSALIDRFKTWRLTRKPKKGKAVGRTTCNRYLSTLRKALRHAEDPLKLITRVPRIHLFPKSSVCERQREFVFSDEEYQRWLSECPDLLRDASILARESGICVGELLALQKDCVELWDEEKGMLWGFVDVRRGLKRDARHRKLDITTKMRGVLIRQMERSKCRFVFAALDNPKHQLSDDTLSGQGRDMKRRVEFDKDAGLHCLRHTYLTEMAKTTDLWSLQRIAGHANIATTQRYVHAQPESISEAVRTRLRKQQENGDGSDAVKSPDPANMRVPAKSKKTSTKKARFQPVIMRDSRTTDTKTDTSEMTSQELSASV